MSERENLAYSPATTGTPDKLSSITLSIASKLVSLHSPWTFSILHSQFPRTHKLKNLKIQTYESTCKSGIVIYRIVSRRMGVLPCDYSNLHRRACRQIFLQETLLGQTPQSGGKREEI